MANDNNQLLLYQTEDGGTKLQVSVKDGNVWLTQAQMAELFQRERSVISRHIKELYNTRELDEEVTCAKNTHVASGHTYTTASYNLSMILAVGFRVKSHRGIQFRTWARQQLGEYLVKGFVINDQRLSEGETNYFDELVERVRRIRASEKNFYEKVRDIFATAIDYDTRADFASAFFATVQNKFHYAIHGHTAAELIAERVDSTKPFMGMTNWQGEVITQQQAGVAKNYLESLELKRLELLVEQFLSFAELRSVEQVPMYMKNWQLKLDEFLVLNEKQILTTHGSVSHVDMENKVRTELHKYNSALDTGRHAKFLPSGRQP